MLRSVLAGLIVSGLATPALAADAASAPAKPLERQLRQNLQVDPDDAVALARLARIYAATNRAEKARRLYRGMLSLDAVTLETAGGRTMSSHALAQNALRSMDDAKIIRLGSR